MSANEVAPKSADMPSHLWTCDAVACWTYDRVEVIAPVQRRRRWTPEQKIRIVKETCLPGNTVSLIARRHGIAGNQGVLPASDCRALEAQVRELQCLLGKKTMETNCCARLSLGPQAQKKRLSRSPWWPEGGQ